jgi:hypothetical protein
MILALKLAYLYGSQKWLEKSEHLPTCVLVEIY